MNIEFNDDQIHHAFHVHDNYGWPVWLAEFFNPEDSQQFGYVFISCQRTEAAVYDELTNVFTQNEELEKFNLEELDFILKPVVLRTWQLYV